jgi:septal ring factor EnvC (AmiA/AmiB activator)
MARRSPKSDTPLNQKQEELALQESKLREEMQKLERMIAEAPRLAEESSRRQREEILQRASEGGRRLDVSMALQDKRYGDEIFARPRRGSLRKERREGRLLFLVLVIALALAILWLATHLHF